MAGKMLIGPTGRYPDYARGENNYARMLGADTYVLVAKGGGLIHTVVCGVAGTLVKFYDTPSGGTTDDTTEIATLDIGAAGLETAILDIDFSQGLTAVVTGASADVIVTFRGAQTVSPRTFGV